MKLRGLNTLQKLALNFLYEMRNTPMAPPDPRLSLDGMTRVLGIHAESLFPELNALIKEGFIIQFWIEKKRFYKITVPGIREIEKHVITDIEGEFSTSRIGIKGRREWTSQR